MTEKPSALHIASIVVFKDSVTARVHPEWTIRRTDGSSWRDHKGLAWVNPYHRELWDYNIGVGEELVRMGTVAGSMELREGVVACGVECATAVEFAGRWANPSSMKRLVRCPFGSWPAKVV